MEIKKIADIPEVATASKMAKAIGTSPIMIYSAYHKGLLRGSKVKVGNARTVFTRTDILDWLGLEVVAEEPPPQPPPPAPPYVVARRRGEREEH